MPFTSLQTSQQENERQFTNWLKEYIPAQYPRVEIIDNVDWFQAVIPKLNLMVNWAFLLQEKLALKEVGGLREEKSIFISKKDKTKWADVASVIYTEGAGYYIPGYASPTMGNFEVAKLTVVQFDGDARKFVKDMRKAWLSSSFENNRITYKPRIINTTDLGADPDDEQSMVRQLVCANEFDIEGLIVATGCWKKSQSNTDMLDKIVNTYEKVYPNLSVHAEGFPSPEYLKSISVMGQTGYGMSDVGTGKDSPGSELIIAFIDKDDPRPVWVMGWGGMNNVAQAIWKVRETRSPTELAKFLSKLRLYDILGQDDAGAWIAKTFPEVFYIRATGVYGWQPSDEYLDEHIQNHGPMEAIYPYRKWATEGDSPSFMHVYPNGLNDPDKIDQGGWGGRFSLTKIAGIRSMSGIEKETETKYDPYYMYGNTSEGANTIKRWSEGYNNDFAARMDWCIKSYLEANHPPVPVLGHPEEITVKSGEGFGLDASDTTDPDGDSVSYLWFNYPEAGSYKELIDISSIENAHEAYVVAPGVEKKETTHFILKVTDKGTPSLSTYKRIIVNILPK